MHGISGTYIHEARNKFPQGSHHTKSRSHKEKRIVLPRSGSCGTYLSTLYHKNCHSITSKNQQMGALGRFSIFELHFVETQVFVITFFISMKNNLNVLLIIVSIFRIYIRSSFCPLTIRF